MNSMPVTRKRAHIFQRTGQSLFPLLVLWIASIAIGCSDENATGVSSQYSIISGLVTGDSGSYMASRDVWSTNSERVGSVVQGATVVAMWIQPGTTPQPISDTTETDANGRFSLTSNVTNISNAIVVATKGKELWEAVVGSSLNLGGTEYSQPLNDQSTVQAEVYSFLAVGSTSGRVSYPDIVLTVSKSVAAGVEANIVEVGELAAAVNAGESAWMLAIQNPLIGNVSEGTVNIIKLTRANAERAFESALNSAGENDELSAEAFSNYLQADENAYLVEGVSKDAVGKITVIFAQAESNVLAESGSMLRASVIQQFSMISAYLIKTAVDSALQGLFPPSSRLDSVGTAGRELVSQISNTGSLSDIASALNSYHDAIIRFTSESLSGSEGPAVTAIDSTINVPGGPKSNLFRVVQLPLSTKDFVQTYAAFFQGVKSEVRTGMPSLPGVESDEVASILTLINMIGGFSTP